MNTAARALAEGALTSYNVRGIVFAPRNLLLMLLILVLLITGCALVYVKDLNRQLFYQLQVLQQTQDELNVEFGQLLLEQNTLAAPARVQNIAQTRLAMSVPSSQTIVMVKSSTVSIP